MINRIYLTGFMTSGKSTLGPILANVMGWSFFDLDEVIEKEEKKKIVEIFRDAGEKEFRRLETLHLDILSRADKAVISLGGGTMADEKNVRIVKETGFSVYLKASPEAIYKRLKNKIDRPLFRDLVLNGSPEEMFMQRIKDILETRAPYYEKADLVINTDDTRIGYTVDNIAKKITRIINEDKRSC